MTTTTSAPPQAWGELVKQQRKRMKMTHRQLAYAVGVTDTTISRIERGLLTPRYTLMVKISRALRQELDQLFPYPKMDWKS